MATSTTLRASFFSCYTHNQNDVKFTFRFNVKLRTSKGIWETQSISTLCFGPKWAHREVVCEEDYMEVNVNQDSCEATQEVGDQFWGVANSQVQSSTKATWQLMFLQGDGHKTFMSIQEAESLGYIVTSSAHRVVLRTDQRSPHAKVMMVHGVPVEVIQVSVVFRRLQMVVLLDLTMACTLNSGEFNGAWLLWDVPWVMLPLVDESAVFESQYVGIRVDGEFLDQNNATSKGLRLVHSGDLVLIAVPFRAEGGYRKSWVVNNTYKEEFGISLLYEHDFSLTYDGSRRINIKHRLLRVLATPPLCHPPFSLDQTLDNDVAFHILLGNIPSDVVLEEVWINKKQVMSGASNPAIFITPMLYANGSRAFDLRLPFQDASIRTTYLGGGVVQYSAHLKFTLTIIPQRESYYHHTFVSSRVTNTFPPQIMAQCLHQGICFTIVQASPSLSLWEVGVDHEPLTFELVAQRGYKLHNDSHRMTLEVPIYSIGYRYDDINLFNFYGTFELLLRDSRTLQIQASTSKRCLFKTEDMTVCSSDGTITVITGTKSTRPTVQLKKLHLLDPDCRPKQLDESRALFEFRVNTCGTRPMVGESYVVYENEVIHDRQLITDGPNLISRDSQFKLSIRCFYPLNTINRLSMDRIFTTDHANKTVEQNCLPSTFGSLTRAKIRQMPDTEEKVSETSYFSTVPGETQLDPFKNLQMFLTRNTGPVFEKVSSFSDQIPSPTETQNIVDQFSKVLGIVEQHNIEQPKPGHAKQTGEHLGPSVFTWDLPNGFEPSQDLRGLWENHSLSPHQDVSPDINNQPTSTAAQWLDPNTAQTRSMDKRNAKVAGFRVQDITVKSIPKSKQDRPVPDQENIQASHIPGSGKVLTEIQRNWNRKPHQDPQNLNTQPKVPKLAVAQQELQQDQEKLPTVSENKDKKMAFPAGVSHSTARSGPAIAARMQIWTRPHHNGNPYFGRNLDLDLSPHKRFTSALFIRGHGPNRRYSPSVEPAGPVPDKETHSKSDGLSSYGFSDHQGIDRGSGSSGSAEWLPGQDLLWSTNPLSSGSSLYMGLRHRTVSGSGDSGIGTYYSDSLEDSTQKNPPSPLNMKKYPPMRRCSSLTKLSSVADKSTAKTHGHLYNPGFQGSLDRGLFNHHKKVCGSKVDLHLPLTSSSSSHNLLQYSVGSLPCNHYTRSPGSRALSLSPSSLTSPVKHPSLDNSLSALTAAEVGYSGRQLYGLSSCVGPYVGESSLTSPSLSKTMFLTDQYKPTAECQKSAGARKTSPGKQRHQQEPGLHQLFKVSGHLENPLKVKEGLLRDRELEINWQRQEILLLQAQISENVHRAQQLLQSQRGWLHDANDRNKEESDARIAPEMPCGDEDLNQKLAVAEIKVLHLKNVYQQVIEKYAEDMRKLQKKIKTRDRYISCLNKKFQRECDQSREKQQQIETLEKYLCDLPSPEVVHVQAQQEQVQQKTKELGQKVSDIQKSLEEECALIKDKMLRIELQAKREKELISSVHSLQQKVQECLDDGVRLSMQDLKQLEVENIQLVEQDVRSSQLVQRQKEQIERLTWQLMAVSVRLQKKRGLCHNQNETLLNTFRAVTQNSRQVNKGLLMSCLTHVQIPEVGRLLKEMSLCLLDLQALCCILTQRAQGKEPNVSLLLSMKTLSVSAEETESRNSGVKEELRSRLLEVCQLRKDIDELRESIFERKGH